MHTVKFTNVRGFAGPDLEFEFQFESKFPHTLVPFTFLRGQHKFVNPIETVGVLVKSKVFYRRGIINRIKQQSSWVIFGKLLEIL